MTRIRSNTLAMGGAFLTQAVFVFLQIKILTHWLAPHEFGLFSSVFALGSLLGGVAELGFSIVIVRYGAKFDAETRRGALADLVRVALVLWLLTGLAIGALLAAVSGPVAARLGQPGLTAGLIALGFFAALSFSLRSYASAVFQGQRVMPPALGLEFTYMAGITVLYLVVGSRLTASAVLWCLLGWSLAVGTGGMWIALRGLPRDRADSWPVRARRLLGEIRGFWGGAMATGIIAIALESMDRLVLAALVPLEAVGAYHVAGRMSLFMRKVLYIPQQVAGPELAFKWERGAAGAITKDLVLFSKLEWVLGMILAVPVVFGAHAAILLASDARYLAAEPVLIALAGALPILCLQSPLTSFLRASGAIWVSVGGEAIWLGLYLATGTLLLPVLGLPGFALGQMIAALGTLLYTVVLLRRLKLPRPATRLIAVHGTVAVILWAAAALAVRARPIPSLAGALGVGLLFGLLLNLVLVRAGYFSADEEERLLGFLGGGPWFRLGRALLAWPRFGGERAHG